VAEGEAVNYARRGGARSRFVAPEANARATFGPFGDEGGEGEENMPRTILQLNHNLGVPFLIVRKGRSERGKIST